MSEEDPRSIFIFGDKEIHPEKVGNELKFPLPQDDPLKDQKFAIYKKNPTNKIPVNIEDPDRGSTDGTFQKNLRFFGEMYFGALWNEEEKKFKRTPKLEPIIAPLAIIDRLEKWKGMKVRKHQKMILQGLSSRTIENYIQILLAYKDKILVEATGEDAPPDFATQKAGIKRAKKKSWTVKMDETTAKNKEAFLDSPPIIRWKKYLESRGKERTSSLFDTLYLILAVNAEAENPEALTVDLADKTTEQKVAEVEKYVEVYRHWMINYSTPPEFYLKEWRSTVEEAPDSTAKIPLGKMIGFPDDETIYSKLQRTIGKAKARHKIGTWREFQKATLDPERELDDTKTYAVKGSKTRVFGSPLANKQWGTSREKNAVRNASTAISSFILSAGEGYDWEMPEQGVHSILSKKIDPPKHADIGQDFSDDEIRMARKFLETGKKHVFRDLPEESATFTDDGVEYNQKIIRKVLVEVDDDDPHYNTTLPQYKQFGSPYGKLKPATMFFRLAMLTGWRITEGVTCGSEEITKKQLKSREKSSGWWMDNDNNMAVAFQVRKTAKYAQESYFISIIPPYSTEVLDTAETMKRILLKTNIYRFKNPNIHDEGWSPQYVELTDGEKAENAKEMAKENIFPSRVLVGENGMMFPEMTNGEPTFELKTGLEIDEQDNSEFILAYLAFPLREMFAQIKKTKVKIRKAEKIKEISELDRKMDIDVGKREPTKVFGTEHGWAVTCGEGCRKTTKTGKKDKTYSYGGEKAIQDKLRYDDPQDYWIDHPDHSLRHLFAQVWLGKTGWNYGFVADTGHWTILQTLKDHYGEIPDKIMGERIMDLMSKERITYTDSKGRTGEREVVMTDKAQALQGQNLTGMGENLSTESKKLVRIAGEEKEEEKTRKAELRKQKKKDDKRTVTTVEEKEKDE